MFGFSGRVRARDQRGAAVVEFALIGTLLMTLVLGIISYGFMLSFRQGMSQGAAEGARAVVVGNSSANQTTDAINAVNEALKAYGVSCSIPSGTTGTLTHAGSNAGTCSVSVAACLNDAGHQCVKVALAYNYRDHALIPTFPGLGIFLPGNLNYTANARVS